MAWTPLLIATSLGAAAPVPPDFLRFDVGAAVLVAEPERYAQRTVGLGAAGTYSLGLMELGSPGRVLSLGFEAGWVGFAGRDGGAAAAVGRACAGPGLFLPMGDGDVVLEIGARAGFGVTGTYVRGVLLSSAALNMRLDTVVLGPFVQYVQVIEGRAGSAGNASVVVAGLGVGFGLGADASQERAADERRADDIGRIEGATSDVTDRSSGGPLRPARDSDSDGVLDADDACPALRGTRDARGCPSADRDSDGVVDAVDGCPDLAGGTEKGCPPRPLVRLERGELILFEELRFGVGSAELGGQTTLLLLDQVAEVMQNNPRVRVRVDGHAAERSSNIQNFKLSTLRAEAVREALMARGVEQGRIEAVGYGDTKPADGKPASRVEVSVLGEAR